MLQLKSMQTKINEKNYQIQELSGKLKRLSALKDNFKYIASLNHEYFSLDLGEGEYKFTEIQKFDLEKIYMEMSRFNLVRNDVGIQVNLTVPANPNSTF